MVYLLAFLLGLVNLVDMPARQAFVMELVGSANVANAVSLNSVVVNAGRIIGPALAGILVVKTSVAVCFFVNATSYLAVIAACWRCTGRAARRPARAARTGSAPGGPPVRVGRTPSFGVRSSWSPWSGCSSSTSRSSSR